MKSWLRFSTEPFNLHCFYLFFPLSGLKLFNSNRVAVVKVLKLKSIDELINNSITSQRNEIGKVQIQDVFGSFLPFHGKLDYMLTIILVEMCKDKIPLKVRNIFAAALAWEIEFDTALKSFYQLNTHFFMEFPGFTQINSIPMNHFDDSSE